MRHFKLSFLFHDNILSFLSNKLLVYSVPVLLYQVLTEFGADSFRRAAAFDPRVIFDARYNIWNSDFKMFTWGFPNDYIYIVFT